jgi:hypothetical protein
MLTVTYLTDAHRAVCCAASRTGCAATAGSTRSGSMRWAMWSGVYHGARSPIASRLLTGSHYDTVRNAGQYDGRLGIPGAAGLRAARCPAQVVACPSVIEVVAFAEEEGQRYKATFLGSSALTGRLRSRLAGAARRRRRRRCAEAMSTGRTGDRCQIPVNPAGPRALSRVRRSAHRAGPGAQRPGPAAGRGDLDQRQRALHWGR